MDQDIGAVLRTLAKTAALCVGLGLLLYGAVTVVVALPHAQWMIGLLLAAPLAVLVGHVVIDAHRTGVFPQRGGAARRDSEPRQFWFNMAWFAACGLLLAVLAAWCAVEWAGAP